MTGPSATYAGSDSSTQGTWTGHYGVDGQLIVNDLSNVPSYASLILSGDAVWTWTASTSDPRALQTANNASTRIASTFYANSFNIDLNLTDGNTHKISLYLCDWDYGGRVETISIIDPATSAVLDTRVFSSFYDGEYATWNIKGYVRMQVSLNNGNNAIVNAIFFN